jgi:DNA-nicking Smr family endonuclease
MQTNNSDSVLNSIEQQFRGLLEKDVIEMIYYNNNCSFAQTVKDLSVIVEGSTEEEEQFTNDSSSSPSTTPKKQTKKNNTNKQQKIQQQQQQVDKEDVIDFLYSMFMQQSDGTSNIEYERDVIQMIYEECNCDIHFALQRLMNAAYDIENIEDVDSFVEREEVTIQPKPTQKRHKAKTSLQKEKKKRKQKLIKEERARAIHQLREIFVTVDSDFVESALVACNYDTQAAFDLLNSRARLLDLKKDAPAKKKFQKRDELVGWKQGLSFNQWQVKTTIVPPKPTIQRKRPVVENIDDVEEEEEESEPAWSGNNPNTVTDSGLSMELKLERLKKMFAKHSVNHDVLENVFNETGGQIAKTVERLNALYPQQNKKPQTVIAPQIADRLAARENELKKEQEKNATLPEIPEESETEVTAPINQLHYSVYREAGYDYAQLRNQFFTMAVQAFSRGDGRTAKELANRGREAASISKVAHYHASRMIFDQTNTNSPSSSSSSSSVPTVRTIDLHGLHVSEAIALLERVIQEELQEQYKDENRIRSLNIITGVGRNSAQGKAKIKPAVEKYLDQENFKYREPYPGMYQVKLRRH